MGDWLAYPRWCTSPPPHLDWRMGLYHGDVGAVCCHAEIDWYESFPPRARWSFLHGPFLRGGVCVVLILSLNQSAVSLGWFWAMIMHM